MNKKQRSEQKAKNMSEYNDNTNEPGMVNDDDGVYQTQQPLTFEKAWLVSYFINKEQEPKNRELKTENRELKTETLRKLNN